MENLCILSNLWDPTLDAVPTNGLSASINRSHRNSVLKWLFESLDLLKVEDRVFFATIMLADRYCSRLPGRRRLEGSELQLVILSSLCCCLKVVESSLDLSVKAFLEHVSGGHVDPKDIFATESKIIQSLDFNTFTPPLSVYLESFYFALTQPAVHAGPLEQPVKPSPLPTWAVKQYNLALYLLYLVVFDTDMLHSHRPAEVAAGCILTSAFTLIDERGEFEFEVVIDGLIRAGWIDQSVDIAAVISEMTRYWRKTVAEQSDLVDSIKSLFDNKDKFFVSRIVPKSLEQRRGSGGVIVSGG